MVLINIYTIYSLKTMMIAGLSLVYNFLYGIVVSILLIFGFVTNNKIIKQKIFFKKYKFSNSFKTIWLHGASVGEVFSANTLINVLHQQNNIVISTNTLQGFIQANNLYGKLPNVFVCFLPYDFSIIAKKFVKAVNPTTVLWLEQDFFINFFKQIKQHNANLILLNARMSNTSYKRYSKIKSITEYILKHFNLILAGSSIDASKYQTLTSTKVLHVGNLKYTNLNTSVNNQLLQFLQTKLLYKNTFTLLSTHFNEEEEIIKQLQQANLLNNINIIIIPRHTTRAVNIQQTISNKFNINCCLLSSAITNNKLSNVIVVDSMGLVNTICQVSTVVYVGKSLLANKKGGHNLLEPLQANCCVIVGKYMDNFTDITNLALKHNCIVMVNSFAELVNTANKLINDIPWQTNLKANTKQFFKANNILQNTINELTCYIK